MGKFVTVCKQGDIPNGFGRRFSVDGEIIGLFYVGGRYHALDDRCPHAGASLVLGTVEQYVSNADSKDCEPQDCEPIVRCRIHHWGFCLATGRYVDQDIPQYNARSFAVRLDGDDVQVELDSGRNS